MILNWLGRRSRWNVVCWMGEVCRPKKRKPSVLNGRSLREALEEAFLCQPITLRLASLLGWRQVCLHLLPNHPSETSLSPICGVRDRYVLSDLVSPRSGKWQSQLWTNPKRQELDECPGSLRAPFTLPETSCWSKRSQGGPSLPGGPPVELEQAPCSPDAPNCPKERRIKHLVNLQFLSKAVNLWNLQFQALSFLLLLYTHNFSIEKITYRKNLKQNTYNPTNPTQYFICT